LARGKSLGGDSEPPEIEERLLFTWSAFWDLVTDRPVGMVPGPIPNGALRAYARDYGVSGDLFDSFKTIIRAVDAEYLRLLAPKDPKAGLTVSGSDVQGVKNLLRRAGKKPSE
jgi:hypothetical protein